MNVQLGTSSIPNGIKFNGQSNQRSLTGEQGQIKKRKKTYLTLVLVINHEHFPDYNIIAIYMRMLASSLAWALWHGLNDTTSVGSFEVAT